MVEEQPVIILSSDDEDNTNSDFDSSVMGDRSLSRLSNDGFNARNLKVSSLMNKEPIITEEEDTGGTRVLRSMVGIKDGSCKGRYIMLKCRRGCIGSYRVVPKERVILSPAGIRLTVPTIEDSRKTVVLTISKLEIKKVLIHYGKGMQVLSVYIRPAAAAKIRSWLKMESKDGPYYDPTSSDEIQKRIILLPERLTEDDKLLLKNIFLENMMDELTTKEANELLVRASLKEINSMTKRAEATSGVWTDDTINTIMVYPPRPTKHGIPINTEDYACLEVGQCLNDVIIDFYLKYLTLSVLSEEDQARTHVFSTFFYKRLTTRPDKRRSNPVEDDPKLSPAEKRHLRVKSWTKNLNIFEKDFIIIPINQHGHWFLAIICFPGLNGPVKMSDNTPVTQPKHRKPKKGIKQYLKARGSTDSATLNVTEDCLKGALDPYGEEGSDRDEAEGDDEEMEQGTSDNEDESSSSESQTEKNNEKYPVFSDVLPDEPIPPTPKQPKPGVLQQHRSKGGKVCREPIKQPCILIFDSLPLVRRSRVVATLRDYLRIEYKVKEGKDREFSKDTIKGGIPKVPRQNNLTDCGIYVLQYAESFFKDPIKDYYLPMGNLADWFSKDVVNRKREEINNLLLELMEQQDIDVLSLNLPKLEFRNCEEQQLESIACEADATVENTTAQFMIEDSAKIPNVAESKKKKISKVYLDGSGITNNAVQGNSTASNPTSVSSSEITPGKTNNTVKLRRSERIRRLTPKAMQLQVYLDGSGITNNAVQGNSTASNPTSVSSSEITPGKTNNTMKLRRSERIRRLTPKAMQLQLKDLK